MQYPDSDREANSSKLCAGQENSHGTILQDNKLNTQLESAERENLSHFCSQLRAQDTSHAVTTKRRTPLWAALSFYSSRKQAQ